MGTTSAFFKTVGIFDVSILLLKILVIIGAKVLALFLRSSALILSAPGPLFIFRDSSIALTSLTVAYSKNIEFGENKHLVDSVQISHSWTMLIISSEKWSANLLAKKSGSVFLKFRMILLVCLSFPLNLFISFHVFLGSLACCTNRLWK